MARRTNPVDEHQVDLTSPSYLASAARARSADPDTSKAAAASVANLRASHQRVLAMFRTYGDMTDETLQKYLDELAEAKVAPKMSLSGTRSRRSELSKPNMDRLDALAVEVWGNADPKRAVANPTHPTFVEVNASEQGLLRDMLRTEGFRSPLWDTGKRENLSTGRMAIVWGIAR